MYTLYIPVDKAKLVMQIHWRLLDSSIHLISHSYRIVQVDGPLCCSAVHQYALASYLPSLFRLS